MVNKKQVGVSREYYNHIPQANSQDREEEEDTQKMISDMTARTQFQVMLSLLLSEIIAKLARTLSTAFPNKNQTQKPCTQP